MRIAMVLALGALIGCSDGGTDDGKGAGGAAPGAGGAGVGGAGGQSAGGAAGTAAGGAAGSSATDTWETFARGFFSTYCVECHGAGNTMRDYTRIDDVRRDQAAITCGVSAEVEVGCGPFPPPGQFPIDNAGATNPKPSDAERARLVAWIRAGLAE